MANERPARPERPERPSRPGGGRPDRREGGGGRPDRRPYHKKKVCRFCKDKALAMIDYKDAKALRPYVTEKGRIVPRRISGTCAKHQRMVSNALKRARNLAILPFTTTSI